MTRKKKLPITIGKTFNIQHNSNSIFEVYYECDAAYYDRKMGVNGGNCTIMFTYDFKNGVIINTNISQNEIGALRVYRPHIQMGMCDEFGLLENGEEVFRIIGGDVELDKYKFEKLLPQPEILNLIEVVLDKLSGAALQK